MIQGKKKQNKEPAHLPQSKQEIRNTHEGLSASKPSPGEPFPSTIWAWSYRGDGPWGGWQEPARELRGWPCCSAGSSPRGSQDGLQEPWMGPQGTRGVHGAGTPRDCSSRKQEAVGGRHRGQRRTRLQQEELGQRARGLQALTERQNPRLAQPDTKPASNNFHRELATEAQPHTWAQVSRSLPSH